MWVLKATNVRIVTSTCTRSLSTGTRWRSSVSIFIVISLSPPRVEEACVGREEKKKKIGRVWPGSKSGGSNLDLRGLQVTYLLSGDLSREIVAAKT